MSLARVLALTLRLIRQIVRDRRTLLLILLVPAVIMTLLYLVLNGTSTPPTVGVVRPAGKENDQINTLIDESLPPKDKLGITNIHEDQVEQKLKDGNIDAALIFPGDFAQQLRAGKKPGVKMTLEGSDPNQATALRETLSSMLRQLGIVVNVSRLQAQSSSQGQGQPPSQSLNIVLTLPFSIQDPKYLYGGSEYTSNDALAPVFIGLFSFFFVFLLTSVAFLRERASGTIERILVSPMRKGELVLGYVCGFTLFALVQSLLILLFVVFVLHVHYSGNLALVFLVSLLLTIGSVNLGIFLSTFARNEFQIVQFVPMVLGVQILLSGAIWPIKQLPIGIRPVSYLLPLTYANDALRGVMIKGYDIGAIVVQLTVLALFALLMIFLSTVTIRRRVA